MFKVEIRESKKELNKKERINVKQMSNNIKLDSATKEGDVVIEKVENIVILDVHNDKGTPQDYVNILVMDDQGYSYVTGSESFYRALMEIDEEMSDEEYGIVITRRPSANYQGRDFLTCTVI